jgi:hypothetical protein
LAPIAPQPVDFVVVTTLVAAESPVNLVRKVRHLFGMPRGIGYALFM